MNASNHAHLHPIRALCIWVVLIWLLITGMLMIRAQRSGWRTTGGSAQTFELTQVITIPKNSALETTPRTITVRFVFTYFTSRYQHPILADKGPEAIWIDFAGLDRITYDRFQGSQEVTERISISELPMMLRSHLAAAQPRWYTTLETLGPNQMLLGTNYPLPTGRYGFNPSKRRELLWSPRLLSKVLLHLTIRGLLLALIPAILFYILFYRVFYCTLVVDRRIKHNLCPVCAYPMQGVQCPECGNRFRAGWFISNRGG